MSHRVFDFKRIPPPPPAPPRRVCTCCKAMAAECEVPMGEGALSCCWLCAHLIVDHGVDPTQTVNAEACECTPEDVYPDRMRFEQGDVDREYIEH